MWLSNCLFVVALTLAWQGLAKAAVDTGKCGNENYLCIDGNAKCQDGTCQCNDGFYGKALLACGRKDFAICQMFSDPSGKTYALEPKTGDPLKFSLPCPTLMTTFTAARRISHQNGAIDDISCTVQVFAAQRHVLGRMVVHGFELHLGYTKLVGETETTNEGELSLRVTGGVTDGNYEWKVETRTGFTGEYTSDLSLGQLNSLGGTYFWRTFGTQQVGIFFVDYCGFDITFRPPDLDTGKNKDLMPGLSVAVSMGSDRTVSFPGADKAFCLHPDPTVYNLEKAKADTQLDMNSAFVYNALTATTMIPFPNVALLYCMSLGTTVNTMSDDTSQRQKAFKTCDFFLHDNTFINCIEKTDDSSDVLHGYDQCLDSVFNNNKAMCDSLVADVEGKGCTMNPALDCTQMEQ